MVDRQQTLVVLGLDKVSTGTLLFSKLSRRVDKVVLERFHKLVGQVPSALVLVLDAVLGEVVGKADNTNTEASTGLSGSLSALDRITLVVDKSVEATDCDITERLKFFQTVDLTNVDSGENTQGDLAVLVVDMSQGACR